MKEITATCDHCGKEIQKWKEYNAIENNRKINKNTDFGLTMDLCDTCNEIYEDEKNKFLMYQKAFEGFTYKFIGKEKELENRYSGEMETGGYDYVGRIPTAATNVVPPPIFTTNNYAQQEIGRNNIEIQPGQVITTTNSRYRGDIAVMRSNRNDEVETNVATGPA